MPKNTVSLRADADATRPCKPGMHSLPIGVQTTSARVRPHAPPDSGRQMHLRARAHEGRPARRGQKPSRCDKSASSYHSWGASPSHSRSEYLPWLYCVSNASCDMEVSFWGKAFVETCGTWKSRRLKGQVGCGICIERLLLQMRW